ncbi:MAG TPA: hypothetical protein VGI45_27230 [Terracidiphilus sp.]|jgi:hypothetical protein
MLTGKKVNERQTERLRKFDSDLTGAKTELAKQQERAAKAEGNIALAEQHAKEADAKAEGFRLSIAKAEENAAKAQENLAESNKRAAEADAKAESFRLDIAQANKQAASANETAEREHLARLQLEARLADRVVTPEQQKRLRDAFAPLSGKTIDVVILGDTPEISFVANAISQSMKFDGVLVNELHPMGVTSKGVLVGVEADAPGEFKETANGMIAIFGKLLMVALSCGISMQWISAKLLPPLGVHRELHQSGPRHSGFLLGVSDLAEDSRTIR